MKKQLDFTDRAHYIGSLNKGEQLCDFYEVILDGEVRYIYITPKS